MLQITAEKVLVFFVSPSSNSTFPRFLQIINMGAVAWSRPLITAKFAGL